MRLQVLLNWKPAEIKYTITKSNVLTKLCDIMKLLRHIHKRNCKKCTTKITTKKCLHNEVEKKYLTVPVKFKPIREKTKCSINKCSGTDPTTTCMETYCPAWMHCVLRMNTLCHASGHRVCNETTSGPS